MSSSLVLCKQQMIARSWRQVLRRSLFEERAQSGRQESKNSASHSVGHWRSDFSIGDTYLVGSIKGTLIRHLNFQDGDLIHSTLLGFRSEFAEHSSFSTKQLKGEKHHPCSCQFAASTNDQVETECGKICAPTNTRKLKDLHWLLTERTPLLIIREWFRER